MIMCEEGRNHMFDVYGTLVPYCTITWFILGEFCFPGGHRPPDILLVCAKTASEDGCFGAHKESTCSECLLLNPQREAWRVRVQGPGRGW